MTQPITFRNPSPLWQKDMERDACGVGFIANLRGEKTHAVIDRAMEGLRNLAHRGAIDADAVTGDGAGLLTQIPYALLRRHLKAKGKIVPKDKDLAVAMLFLPRDEYQQSHAKKILEEAVHSEGLVLVAWRQVPVEPGCLGKKAELTRPDIWQAIVACKADADSVISEDEFERRCFLATKVSERRASEAKLEGFYICSFSSRTVTYKGLFNAPQVRKFFTDLKDPEFTTAFAIFHQRFATNTLPDWTKAHPFRCIAHNGEIN
ncbi:MAG TPA: glutamate synthase subunit alpha, partial [Opitutae bacterium]|nr:glutamate synthase subunit alpha [Opitutae bacterium]